MRLTDVGRVVYERGQEALGVVHRLTLEVSDLSSLGRGQLTVGIPPMVNLFFSPAVSAFRQRYPNLLLTLDEHGGQVVEQLVASGELEVGATVLPGDSGLGSFLPVRPLPDLGRGTAPGRLGARAHGHAGGAAQ